MDFDKFKDRLTDYVNQITQRSKDGFYVCPLCGSGTGKHQTGAFSINPDGLHWKCFACNRGGDIFDLCQEYEKIDSSEAAKRIASLYGDGGTMRNTAADEPVQGSMASHSFADDIARFAAALDGSPGQSYLQGRGLTVDTMKRFKLGYDASRQCVTIPYNPAGTYYGRRSVNPDATKKHDNLKNVAMPVFNSAALYASDVCFVVESPLCAISIMQEGGTAVAISGTGGKNRLIRQLKQKPTQAAIVLCLDNDDAGRKAAEDIGQELDSLGLCVIGDGTEAIMGAETDPGAPGYAKDPNEVLQRNPEALRKAVAETIEATQRAREALAKEEEAERQKRTGPGMVDSFLADVQTERYKPLPTGVADIDRALCGGFTRQQLILLGAAPGTGKTGLAQWIFEGMAQSGTASTVFVNLEMSRTQLLARSISRIAARRGNRIRALEILQGYRWTNEQRDAILGAAEEYKATIAPRFIMNPDGITPDIDSLIFYLESEAQRAEQDGQPAPVCVIDYLQLITGQPREDAAAVIKRAVALLKDYAIRHNTICFVITAHNRQSNSTGSVSMESARDTSAIEYSADLQLALTFTDCLKRGDKKPKAPEELNPKERQNVTLRIVKSRFGGAGTDIDLHFDGETMTYTQTAAETDAPGGSSQSVHF